MVKTSDGIYRKFARKRSDILINLLVQLKKITIFVQATKHRNERELEQKIELQARIDHDLKVSSVKQKMEEKTLRKIDSEWSTKNSQKFSEYYLKLEKELVNLDWS